MRIAEFLGVEPTNLLIAAAIDRGHAELSASAEQEHRARLLALLQERWDSITPETAKTIELTIQRALIADAQLPLLRRSKGVATTK